MVTHVYRSHSSSGHNESASDSLPISMRETRLSAREPEMTDASFRP